MVSRLLISVLFILYASNCFSQKEEENEHVEPLYKDFAADIGNNKGDIEINSSFEVAHFTDFIRYLISVEIEYGLRENLGIELEVPFNFYGNFPNREYPLPLAQLESLELTLQYTFLQNKSRGISLAGGVSAEPELSELSTIDENSLLEGLSATVFGILAYQYNPNWHQTLILSTGLIRNFELSSNLLTFEADYSFHYKFPSGSILGSEINANLNYPGFTLHVRPQFGWAFAEDWMLGIVAGIPIIFRDEKESIFLRLSREI